MGIDFSHSDAHWAYSGFNRFRRALAQHEGFDLDRMLGFTRAADAVSWDTVTSPLKPLLNHSDCDGEMTPAECAQVAPRLREVVRAVWPDPREYDHAHGLLLAEAMERCAANGEPLVFC